MLIINHLRTCAITGNYRIIPYGVGENLLEIT